jgi:hypothetical protein
VRAADEPAAIVARYVRDGQLLTMPRPGQKRQVVLEHIVQSFEPGRRYEEVAVNLVLRQWWADVPALRRYLVDAGLLAREAGEYWRIGGPVEV